MESTGSEPTTMADGADGAPAAGAIALGSDGRPCERCGKPYKASQRTRRFCGRSCKTMSSRARRLQQLERLVEEVRQEQQPQMIPVPVPVPGRPVAGPVFADRSRRQRARIFEAAAALADA